MKLSICLATYNGGTYIDAQLSSIVPQLVAGDEIIIADDGSGDDTLARVSRFAPWVRVVATSRVGNIAVNFERAIAAARGDAIVLCDQDDVWLSGRLDRVRRSLLDNIAVLLNGQVVDENLAPRDQTIFELVKMKPGIASNFIENSFIGCCMAFRHELCSRLLPFPPGIPWHDWYIGLVAEKIGRVERDPTITMLYRRHAANASPTGGTSSNSLYKKVKMRAAILRAFAIAVYFRKARRTPQY